MTRIRSFYVEAGARKVASLIRAFLKVSQEIPAPDNSLPDGDRRNGIEERPANWAGRRIWFAGYVSDGLRTGFITGQGQSSQPLYQPFGLTLEAAWHRYAGGSDDVETGGDR